MRGFVIFAFASVSAVAGGAIRRLEKHEDGGRRFGIEVIEGRDLSQVQPKLMQFAERHLPRLVRNHLERSVTV